VFTEVGTRFGGLPSDLIGIATLMQFQAAVAVVLTAHATRIVIMVIVRVIT